MALRIYRLTSTNTGGGAGAVGIATTTMVSSGTIVGITVGSEYRADAAANGVIIAELALNNTSLTNAVSASGAPSEQLLTRCFSAAAANATSQVNFFVPMRRKVQQGNQICINQTQAGTAPSRFYAGFDVLVEE